MLFVASSVEGKGHLIPVAVFAAACGVFYIQRTGTNSRIVMAGSVFAERIGADGRVKSANGVVSERCSANSGEMVAGRVPVAHSKTNGQVEVGVVVPERLRSNGHVKVASGVAFKRPRTNRHVILAGSIVSQRISTHGGIVDSNRSVDVEQSVIALSSVAARIAAIR